MVWYDAVTTEGKLRWQDSLTDLNQPFFDACDALFVNYTWRVRPPGSLRGDPAAAVAIGLQRRVSLLRA